uniref:HEAT repeat domain-containing protein n=1 Tax=uncultured Polaribacter sp. TaxID=174711 RepID=UPI002610FC90|nr:HEAT repeat domain-containing protein [uncultured Polaribacter sp.]
MDYTEFKETITDYLSDNLSEEKRIEFETFLEENKVYQEEFEFSKTFWNQIDEDNISPSSTMDMNFYSMLKNEEEKLNKVSFLDKLKNLFSRKIVQKFSYTLAILIVGFIIGNGFSSISNSSAEKIEIAQKETESVRSQLVLTLLDQPSANKRLQAVNEVGKLNKVTKTIITALFSTLNNDENVNVRLSAVDALKKYTNIPEVREGLIKSIINQNSPLVQMELADLMVVLQEKKAVKSFEKIIQEEDVNANVKEKMKESIQSII